MPLLKSEQEIKNEIKNQVKDNNKVFGYYKLFIYNSENKSKNFWLIEEKLF